MSPLKGMLAMAIGAAILSSASIAAAQPACAEGRERDRTGRCCWPGQHFSVAHARCEGVPVCPPGLVEHGDDCVGRAGVVMLAPTPTPAPTTEVPAAGSEAPEPEVLEAATYPSLDAPDPEVASVPAPPATTPDHVTGYLPRGYETGVRATPTAWPLFSEVGRTHARRPVQTTGYDSGLLFATILMSGFGWSIGWLAPILDEASGACGTFGGRFGIERAPCNSWPLAFIPVVGSLISGIASIDTGRFSIGWGLGIGIPSMLLQAAGLISLIVSLTNTTTDYHFEELEAELGEASLSLSFDAPGSDAGASLALRF